MRPTIKLYVLSFFATAIPFGLTMTLIDHFRKGEISIFESVLQAVIFGLLMSVFFVRNQIRAVRKLGIQNITNDALKVNQSDSIEKDISIEKIHELLQENPVTKKWKLALRGLKIEGKAKTTWGSWGEKIEIYAEDGVVHFSSKPSIPTTLMDSGKNLQNIILIREILINN